MTSTQSEPAPSRQRIAKLMARVGLCSRRDAEAWIVDGRVSVNGDVLTSPAHDVGPDDAILVDGAPLPSAQKTRLFMFHKPRGLVTSDRDPEGRATVADHLRANWPDGPRVVTIGRLDFNTEGLLLLTNDGGLARMLELPKTGWVRRYRVRAKGETDQAVLDRLREGLTIDGIDYAGMEATLDRTQGANVWLTMGLREGKNREVKRVLEHIGLEVNRLIRLSFGPFQLGDLAEGAVEEVRTRVLRDQLGAALAAAAGVAFEDAAPPPASKPVRADRKPGRAPGAERVNKGERPPPRGRDARGPRPERGGERPLRRPREAEPPPPLRERPAAGPRKHVSALRAEESATARRGPRRRIERADVTDRRDRTVAVERLVGARPTPLEPTRTRGADKPARRDETGPARGAPRRQASPSALAKRARTARSGGYGTEHEEAAPRHERSAGDRGERGAAAGKSFGDKRPRRDDAEPRRQRGSDDRHGGDRSRSESRPKARGERPSSGDRRQASGNDRRPEAPRRETVRRDNTGEARPRKPARFEGERSPRTATDAPRGAGRPRRSDDTPRDKKFEVQRTERKSARVSREGASRGDRTPGGAGGPSRRPSGGPGRPSGGKPHGRPAGAKRPGGAPGRGPRTGGPSRGKPRPKG